MGTRERLIDSAISIIENEGEAAIRVDRVSEMAGFTKPVLYHHFGDREGLVVEAQIERFRRVMDVGLAETADAVERATTAAEVARAMTAWFTSFGTADGVMRRRFRIEVLGSAVSRPSLRNKVIEVHRHQAAVLASLLAIIKERGWMAVDANPHDLAMWWIGLVLSRHLAEMDPDCFDTTQWDHVTEQTVRWMILGTGSTETED